MYIGNSTSVGDVGEAVAIAEFEKRGIFTLRPFSQNLPYDLVIIVGNKFYKVQCKTTSKVHDGVVMRFSIYRTNGFTSTHIPYTSDEIDFLFLYCIENGYCGIVPIQDVEGIGQLNIRLTTPKNNQFNKIRMAIDYHIDTQLPIIMQNSMICPFTIHY